MIILQFTDLFCNWCVAYLFYCDTDLYLYFEPFGTLQKTSQFSECISGENETILVVCAGCGFLRFL